MTVRWNIDCEARMNQEIEILYEDDFLIVCIKPPGIAAQGAKGFQTDFSDLLRLHIQKENNIKGEPYLGIIHRLDQPTGGIMVFAKEKGSAAILSAQVSSNQMKKRYYAVLEKKPPVLEGILKDYLQKDGKANVSCIVDKEKQNIEDGKFAELSYKVIGGQEYKGQELYLADIELKTGRHHQIRAQFSHIGCPLYGDRKYNPSTNGRGLGLFSYYLEFFHPKTKKRMEFKQIPLKGIFTLFFQE